MSDWRDPWHTLVVTVVHYHDDVSDQCADFDANSHCNGHAQPGEDTEAEVDRELTHPDECRNSKDGDDVCCCEHDRQRGDTVHLQTHGGFLGCACRACYPFTPCAACAVGKHADCPEAHRYYHCPTAEEVNEHYDYNGGPLESGTYRVRASGSGPDYEGDYDQECEYERVEEVSAS